MVKVWDAQTGNLVKTLAIEVGSRASFSPDGRWPATFSPDGPWHATTGGGVRLWAVGTWQERPFIDGSWPAFSPDRKTIAVAEGVGVVRLVNLDTGRDYARLESTGQHGLEPQCFTPDGTRLIVVGPEDQAIYVWNLKQIREQLAEMGLDWDLPKFPRVGKAGESLAEPLKVRVVAD
jgi:WD40 repeat protein